MTPAINLAKKAKIKYSVHEYNHDASAESYGLEAAEKLSISPVGKSAISRISSTSYKASTLLTSFYPFCHSGKHDVWIKRFCYMIIHARI